MENTINYYYGKSISNILKQEDYYIFDIDNERYIFAEVNIEIEELKKILDLLNNSDILYHLLVLDKNQNLTIKYDNKDYALLKVRCDLDKKININEFNNIIASGKNNWGKLWEDRIDYYELQLNEVIKEYNIKYAMQYYIGLAECAISYYNNLEEIYDKSKLKYVIGHRINSFPINAIDFYNPLNMIIDLDIRDICEYLKESFFSETMTNDQIIEIIKQMEFDDATANYFYLRLLYPSYFFNLYDEYVISKEVNDKLFFIIKKSPEYELLLNEIYQLLSLKHKISFNCWFIKPQR